MIRHIFGMQSIKLEPPPKKKNKRDDVMGFLFFVRIDVYYESERIKIICIYLKKKEKNGKLVEKIFPNRRRRVYSGDQR